MSQLPSELDARVAEAIQNSPHLSQHRLRYETHQGHVTIRGTVGTFFLKQMAQEAVRRVEGVKMVANELEVA